MVQYETVQYYEPHRASVSSHKGEKMKKDDKARVRVFFGEIEGDNESIRDGLRSIAQALRVAVDEMIALSDLRRRSS